MARTIPIGYQEFDDLIRNGLFYIDKSKFIEEWWNKRDRVTLITRPRRFGKTLTMSMIAQFFSVEHAGCGLFDNLAIWEKEDFRRLQGTYPVIALSFSDIKEHTYEQVKKKICEIIVDLYNKYDFLADSGLLNNRELEYFGKVSADMEDYEASISLRRLSGYLQKYYGEKVIILLDEYDTPMQEAYVGGYWQELVSFTRSLFNATFKNNPYLERAVLTGVTRISRESIFSDLNNLKIVTTTSEEYADCFGFTEAEVFASLEEYGLSDKKQAVKDWYDGFTFGKTPDIYNPWSIINFLDTGKLQPYWANTSSNMLVSKLIQEGSRQIKENFEQLLCGNSLKLLIDEQIVYDQLPNKESSVWSLLLASGYLRVTDTEFIEETGQMYYNLALTNKEVRIMFSNLIHGWFSDYDSGYNDFIKALLQNDLKVMNHYMNRIAMTTFSFFDSGKKPSAEREPERFFHGFVLGLIVELENRYFITSNRESGFGRYDVVLEPKNQMEDAMILEFKVFDPEEEEDLSDTVQRALMQIDEKKYESALTARGIPEKRIKKYGFAFRGKEVLIGSA